MGGGSIRISDTTVQEQVFGVIGIAPEEARERFGFLLDALRYGAPPHGGIAYGIDRLVQRLLGADSIREVIAFPEDRIGRGPAHRGARAGGRGAASRARPGAARTSFRPTGQLACRRHSSGSRGTGEVET